MKTLHRRLRTMFSIFHFLCLCLPASLQGQTVSHDFRGMTLAAALETLSAMQSDYKLTFIHNDLEQIGVTANVKAQTVPEAVKMLCKGLPVKVKQRGQDIFIQYKAKDAGRTMLLYGKVYSSRTHNELPGAMVYLLSRDSTVLDSCLAKNYWQQDDKSGYWADYSFRVPQMQENYIFKARFPGYETGYLEYAINNVHRREFMRQLPPLYLLEVGRMLKEVTVTASKVMFYHRGDTIVYNADAFQLAEGSMLDALIKQLPGVELKSDGRIYHNGKFVQSLLLNGKEFFRGDNRVMLDNLPSYTVKQIEIYDKYGEQSEFLGQKLEGDKQYVMDVRLKKEYSIGWLLNLEAGGGTDERYLARLFALRFTDHSRLSVYANANNLNDDLRPGENDRWQQSDQTGRTTQQQGGLDYNVDDRWHKWHVEGNARFTHARLDDQQTTLRTNFLRGGDTHERSRRVADNRSFRLATWHQFRYNFSKVQLTLAPNLSYTHTDNRSQFTSAAFTQDDSLINANQQQGILRGHELRAALTAKATIKLEGSNDYIELEANTNRHDKDDDRFNRQQVSRASAYYADQSVSQQVSRGSAYYADQYFKNHPDRYQNIWTRAMYHWAIRQGMSLDASVSYEHRDTRREQSLYLLDRLDRHDSIGVLPSVSDYEQTMDRANSYDSHLREDYYAANPILWWFPKTRGGTWSISMRLPMRLLNQWLHYQRGSVDTTVVRRPFLIDTDWSYAQWNSKSREYRVFIAPRISASAPSLENFVNIRDATDPLNVHLGNPDLGNTYRYKLQVGVVRNQQQKQAFQGLELYYEYIQNALAMSSLFDPTTGVHTYQPFSINGNWNMHGQYGTQFPLDKPKRLFLSLVAGLEYIHSVDLTGTVRLERSTVGTTRWRSELGLSYRLGELGSVKLTCNPMLQWLRSEREDFQNFTTSDYKTTFNATLNLPWKLQFNTDLTLYSRHGYSDAAMNTRQWVWNARLARPFFSGKLLLMLDGFDILGQLDNVSRTINAQGRTETWMNTLPQYVLLHAVWKLNRQPKKKI